MGNGKIEKGEFVKFLKWCIAKEGSSKKAVNARVDKNCVVELKSLAKPPEEVVTVILCMCMLCGQQAKEWKDCMKFMGNAKTFMEAVTNPPEVDQAVKDKVTKKIEGFTVETISKKSRAAGCMLE